MGSDGGSDGASPARETKRSRTSASGAAGDASDSEQSESVKLLEQPVDPLEACRQLTTSVQNWFVLAGGHARDLRALTRDFECQQEALCEATIHADVQVVVWKAARELVSSISVGMQGSATSSRSKGKGKATAEVKEEELEEEARGSGSSKGGSNEEEMQA
jgi:hypothetical protein